MAGLVSVAHAIKKLSGAQFIHIRLAELHPVHVPDAAAFQNAGYSELHGDMFYASCDVQLGSQEQDVL